MSTQAQPDLRYPVGRFQMPHAVSAAERTEFIETIAATPARLRAAVAGLGREQLETAYRPGGWTVRQVVHHLADSHMNSYIRFKLALTEHEPEIKTYHEERWAELPDSALPIDVSLRLVEDVHTRWVTLLRSMTVEQFARPLRHPQMGRMTLDQLLALYNWHGQHHVAHITGLRQRMGWRSAQG
ncbi:MAG TPA: putative metal-dependent hydrolase [Terriglobales bacterium]|nr:putative metal-dependent hydrolase [Terriglobales bacterium]